MHVLFCHRENFLFPPFDVPLEERRKLDASLEILEDSGIGPIIERCTRKSHPAGRKPYNPYRLLASIVHGFAKHPGTVRKVEASLSFDLRFICLTERERPSYAPIFSFLNNVVVPNQREMFSKIIASVTERFAKT